MKAIIFGITGQDGYYLEQLLEKNKIKVFGTSSKKSKSYEFIDLSNFKKVFEYIESITPDYIFCFSAISKTAHSEILENHKIINNGTLNILESIRTINPNCKIFIPGSAVQFKLNNFPIDEQSLQYPNSPYAVDRIYTYNLSKYYRDIFGLKIYYGYLFHHDSPLRNHNHLSIEIIKKIKKLKDTGQNQLIIKNLNYTKEFNHAKDIVKAIWVFLSQDQVFEIVIGSGDPISIKSFISLVLKEFGMDQNFQFGHLGNEEIVTCSPKILKKMGWTPDYNIQGLIRDIILNGNIS